MELRSREDVRWKREDVLMLECVSGGKRDLRIHGITEDVRWGIIKWNYHFRNGEKMNVV